MSDTEQTMGKKKKRKTGIQWVFSGSQFESGHVGLVGPYKKTFYFYPPFRSSIRHAPSDFEQQCASSLHYVSPFRVFVITRAFLKVAPKKRCNSWSYGQNVTLPFLGSSRCSSVRYVATARSLNYHSILGKAPPPSS